MEYCFKIYDINNDGYITREEMMTLMKNCLIRYKIKLWNLFIWIFRQGGAEDDGDGDEGIKVFIGIYHL